MLPSGESAPRTGLDEEVATEDVLNILADETVEPVVESSRERKRSGDRRDRGRDRPKEDRRVIKRTGVSPFTDCLLMRIEWRCKQEKALPLPHSRWEENTDEEDEEDDGDRLSEMMMKQSQEPQNPIFRRAINAIKINLKPERRVLLESSTSPALVDSTTADHHHHRDDPSLMDKSTAAAAPQAEAEEKRKSVRDRLGDKVDPDKPEDAGKSARHHHRDKSSSSGRKEKRATTPTKEKVRASAKMSWHHPR